MTGEAAALGHERGRPVRADRRQGPLADRRSRSPFAECGDARLHDDEIPRRRRWKTSAPTARSRSSAGTRASSPPEPRPARLQPRRPDQRSATTPTSANSPTKAKAWGHPFFLRFDWEMNGFWFPWNEGVNGNRPASTSPPGATSTTSSPRSAPPTSPGSGAPTSTSTASLTPLGELYPGDAYVDWTGLDGFNWGKRRGSPGWQTFNQVFHRTYKRIVTRDRARQADDAGRGRLQRTRAATSRPGSRTCSVTIRHDYRKVRAVIWYDVDDRGTNWPIERRQPGLRTPSAPASPPAPTAPTNTAASPTARSRRRLARSD